MVELVELVYWSLVIGHWLHPPCPPFLRGNSEGVPFVKGEFGKGKMIAEIKYQISNIKL